MKTLPTLPKRVDYVLTAVLGTYDLTRVIAEVLNTGVERIYVCGWCCYGFFAAWNDVQYFTCGDIEFFDSINDAWDYISDNIK